MPTPSTRSSRIPQLGPRKAGGGNSSLSRSTSFLQPRGSITAATTGISAPTSSSLLPPHPPSKLQSPGTSSESIPQPARFVRSYSTPMAPSVRSNQFAVAHDERPQLTIEVPSPVSYSGGVTPSSSSDVPLSFQSLVPPSPSTHNDNIRVLLRIRPPNPASERHPQQQKPQLSRRCLDVAPDAKGVTLAPATLQEKRFGFDHVFTETSSQEQIFLDVGVTAVENTINGFNGCIFAYGQTGSGKTFTMLGGTGAADVHELRASPLRGLIPRIFDHLFARLGHVALDKGAALEYTLACSYLEIYNEKVFDLLEDSTVSTQQPKSLREDAAKGVYVEQLREVVISTEAEAIEWLQLGSSNRRMASTDMNRESSRSHAVFTIKLVQTERTGAGVQFTRRSNLHLVDLAGSEKQSQTKAAGQRLKEAAQINKSLSALGNVIMSLVDVSNGQKRHVHYRDSKLTFLLKDSLGGNAITTIIAAISGEEKYFSETLSTLKFAQRAKFIKNKAVQNQDSDSLLPLLKLEIERLRSEIAQLRAGGGGSAALLSVAPAGSPDELKSSPSSYYQQQLAQLQQLQQSQQQQQQQEAKKNRWEPALDVMDKLLRASGAAAPCDLEAHEVCNPVEIRCERLEMLLYRMICRYEEHKEIAFASERSKHAFRRPVVLLKSGLRAPKRYGITTAAQSSENQHPDGRFLTPSEEKVLYDELARGHELERENNLMRQELCELLEWKALVEEERKHGNADADGYSVAASPEAARPSDEILELLSVYRTLFDEMSEVLQDKRPALSSPPSPGSGSSFTEDNSVSYASGGEDDDRDDRDDRLDFGNGASGHEYNDGDASEDGDVSATYREIQRAHALSVKVERKLDQYQDALQRLEKELLATQDELETSSAATKFAEFQLQQLRTLAAEESDARQQQLNATIAELQHELAACARSLTDSQALVGAKDCALADANAKLAASQQQNAAELERLRRELAASQDSVAELEQLRVAAQTSAAELERLRTEATVSEQSAAELERLRVAVTASERDASELKQLRGALAASQQDVGELEQLRAIVAAAEQEVGDRDRLLEGVNAQLVMSARELETLRGSLAASLQDAATKDSAAEAARAQLSACQHELASLQQDASAKVRALDDASEQLHACRAELEALRASAAAAQGDASAKDHALQDATQQLRTVKTELESLRFELRNAQQDIGSKAHVLDEANSQLHAHRLEVETLRLALAGAQSELESKSRALDDARAHVEAQRLEQRELDELRAALTAARRSVSDKSRALDDARYRVESLEMERDDMAQRVQHEREKLEAQFAKRIRAYEARELAHEDELQQLRAASPPRRASKSSEQENAGMELALLAAQNIIQQLEDKLAALRAGDSDGAAVLTGIVGVAGGSDRQDGERLQRERDAALAENARLQDVIASLQQTARTASSSSRMNSMDGKNVVMALEPARTDVDGFANEVKLEHVALHSMVLGDRHPASPSSMRAISKQNDEIKRLAAERVALNSRLQMTQQKMKRLEEELTRSRNSHVATRSIATEFFCEI